MKNIFVFTKKIILIEDFLKNTGNKFKVVSQRTYFDSKGKAGKQGTTFTLMILQDETDYGIDSSTGLPRENNIFENFDVTILDGKIHHDDIKKGDTVRLNGFLEELSFVLDYSWILRFSEIQKLNVGNNNEK